MTCQGARSASSMSSVTTSSGSLSANGASSVRLPSRRSARIAPSLFASSACSRVRTTSVSSREMSSSAESGKASGGSAGASPLPPNARSTSRSTASASTDARKRSSRVPPETSVLAASGAISEASSDMVHSRGGLLETSSASLPQMRTRPDANARASRSPNFVSVGVSSAGAGPARSSSGQCWASGRSAIKARSGFIGGRYWMMNVVKKTLSTPPKPSFFSRTLLIAPARRFWSCCLPSSE